MVNIESSMSGKSAKQKATIKAKDIISKNFAGEFVRGGIRIDIQSVSEITGGIEVYARAFRDGKQLGFGADGSVDIERFRIFNPPVLVDDPLGDITRTWFDDASKQNMQRKLRYDPQKALMDTLEHTIAAVGKENTVIIPGSVGRTTSTFYPDADTESTSVDGHVSNGPGGPTAWSDAVNAATGTLVNDNSSTAVVTAHYRGSSDPVIFRVFLLFDTSALADSDVVDSAVLSVFPTVVVDNDNDAQAYLAVVGSSPASNTALSTADFDQCGDSIVNPTKLSSDVDISGLGTGAYENFTLNASGIAAITTTGITKLGIREGHDMENIEYNFVGSGDYPTNGSGFTIYTADQTGTSNDPKLVVTHFSPPTVPANFAVTASNGSQDLGLSWDDGSDETGYSIERSDNGTSGWTEINTPVQNSTSYSDTTLGYSTTKYYRMRSYDSVTGLYSAYTSIESATTAPAAPTIGTVTNANASQVLTLSWTDNSSDETTFSIEASAVGSGSGFSEVTTDTTSPYAHNVGAWDATRYYRVRAYRSGDGIYSAYSAESTPVITAPSPPTNSALSIVSGNPRLTWDDNSTTESAYLIERKRKSTGTYAQIASDTDGPPYDDTDVLEAQEYYYKVRTYRASDTRYSDYDSAVNIVVPPAAHSNLQVFPKSDVSGNVSVQLLWDRNSLYETGTLIERSTDGMSWSTVTTTSKGVSQYEDTGLTADTTYYYRVSALKGANASATVQTTVLTSINTASGLSYPFLKKVRALPSE